MKPLNFLAMCAVLLAGSAAHAETLLVDRARSESAMPPRGSTMAEVQSRHGAPAEKLEPRGGQRSQWPPITRWVYPGFTVYFEKGRVIDAVAMRSHPEELGPRPPIR